LRCAYSSALRRWLHVVRRRPAIFIRLGTCSSIVPNFPRKSATKSGTARRCAGYVGVTENRGVLAQLDTNDFEDELHTGGRVAPTGSPGTQNAYGLALRFSVNVLPPVITLPRPKARTRGVCERCRPRPGRGAPLTPIAKRSTPQSAPAGSGHGALAAASSSAFALMLPCDARMIANEPRLSA
jgi:hypothetical protein